MIPDHFGLPARFHHDSSVMWVGTLLTSGCVCRAPGVFPLSLQMHSSASHPSGHHGCSLVHLVCHAAFSHPWLLVAMVTKCLKCLLVLLGGYPPTSGLLLHSHSRSYCTIAGMSFCQVKAHLLPGAGSS